MNRARRNRLAGLVRRSASPLSMRSRFGFKAALVTNPDRQTKENFMSMTAYVDDKATNEIELEVEEMEEVIAPGKSLNHNETFVSD